MSSSSSSMTRHFLPSAICTDGTPGHYYMASNTTSSDYVVFFEGGGGCAHSQTLCGEMREESPQHFTSEGFPESMEAFGFLSGDDTENPMYSSYNRVYVPYCTMDMYLLDTATSDGGLQFRGRPLLEETLNVLVGEAATGTSVVLSGSSAGAVGAFNAAGWLLDSFPQVSELNVVLDSGVLVNTQGYLDPLLEYIQNEPSAAYSPHCSEDFDGGPCCAQFGCMLQRGYYPNSEDKLGGTFIISSAHDAMAGLQLSELGTYKESLTEAIWDTTIYSGQMTSSLRNLAILYPEDLSVFSPSCFDHGLLGWGEIDLASCVPEFDLPEETRCETSCSYGESGQATGEVCEGTTDTGLRWNVSRSADGWKNLQIEGTSVSDAMQEWWGGRGNASEQVALFDECDGFNCNPTCMSQILPGGRDETDGPFVWAVVLVTLVSAVLVLAAGVSAAVWSGVQWKRVKAITAAARIRRERATSLVYPKGGTIETPAAQSQSSNRDPWMQELSGVTGHERTQPLALEWRRLSFWAPQRTKRSWYPKNKGRRSEKQLLFSVDGQVPAGALCALMGPSGSGKSTLLDLLAARTATGRCEGDILFEGASIADQQGSYIRNCGYMRQHHGGYLDGLSVFDNLAYAAMIRTPGTLEDQMNRVETVIQEVSLVPHRSTMAGRLSGGQQRLLALALELLNDRRILFLDEPTSGLDSPASLELVTILRRLSKKVTVVVSIHQPRPEIWQLFSHTVLVKTGRVVFSGPVVDALDGIARYLPGSVGESLVADPAEETTPYSTSFRGALSGGVGHGGRGEDPDTDSTAPYRISDSGGPYASAGGIDFKHYMDNKLTLRRASSAQVHPDRQSVHTSPAGRAATPSSVSSAFCDPKLARCTTAQVSTVLFDLKLARSASTPCRAVAVSCDENSAGSTFTSRVASAFGNPNPARPTYTRVASACFDPKPAGYKSTVSRVANPFWGRHSGVGQEAVPTERDTHHGGCCVSSIAGTAGGEALTSVGIPIDLDAGVVSPPTVQQSVPDKILDMMVLIDDADVIRIQRPAADRKGGDMEHGQSRSIASGSWKGGNGGGSGRAAAGSSLLGPTENEDLEDVSVFCATSANAYRQEQNTAITTANTSATASSNGGSRPASPTAGKRGNAGVAGGKKEEGGGGMEGRRPVWQIAAILLARSRRSGYGMQTLWHFGILVTVAALVAFSFRVTDGESEMLHLVFSVLVSVSMPVLFMYHPLMISNMQRDWAITRVELADGLYPSACATVKVVFDHLAVGVVASFSVVGIIHAIYWHRFISELPASWLGVNIQLSCGVTLVAWMMIALFDSLAISGLPLSLTQTIGVVLNVGWSFFSGTMLIMSNIPTVLRVVTYTSPLYWGSSFMLRVTLDGLDITDDCAHDSPIFCAAGYGDLVANAFDLRARPTGSNLAAIAAFTCAALAILVSTIHTKGRRGRTLEGLRGSSQ